MQVNRLKIKVLNSEEQVYINSSDFDAKIGDFVVVGISNGNEYAEILTNELKEVEDSEDITKLRIATENDKNSYLENKAKEKEIKEKTIKIIREKKLEMKIISCYLSIDCNKMTINFISENRVDFRELVKELATIFKCRIELKQIGPRDEAKEVGGLGPCGRPCCCKEFLCNFEHSTIKMAKNQNLSLNPTKISGLCGKLMCCLAYENNNYVDLLKKMPKINSEVTTKDGKGIAIYNDILKGIVQVKLYSDDKQSFEIKNYPIDDIKVNKFSGGNSCEE